MSKHLNKNIIFASPVPNFFGGAERSMYELITHTKKEGYNPIVVVPGEGSVSKKFRSQDIEVHTIDYDWWARGATQDEPAFDDLSIINGEATMKLIKLLSKCKPFACVSYTATFPWLAYAANMYNIPHIWQVCEILDDNNQWRLRIPLENIMDTLDSYSSKILANSLSTQSFISKYLPRRKEDIDVIYPYVNQKEVLLKATEKINIPLAKDATLCIVGNIQPSKGQMDAIKAVAKLIKRGFDVSLLVIGNDVDKKYYESLKVFVESNEMMGNVHFVGFADNPHKYVAASDIALICSPMEAFGRITVEAMTVGTAVIGARSAGTEEIVQKDKKYGLLYEPGDDTQLARKIEALIKDEVLRKELSERAKIHVSNSFSPDINFEPFFKYLREVEKRGAEFLKLPLADIADAGSYYSAQIKSLKEGNRNLEKRLYDITHSRSWIILNKLHNSIATIRNFLRNK